MSKPFLSLLKEEPVDEAMMEPNKDCLMMSQSSQPVGQSLVDPVDKCADSHRLSTNMNPTSIPPPNIHREVDPNFEPIPRGRCNTWPLLPEGFMESEETVVDQNVHSEAPHITAGTTLVESHVGPPKKNTSRRNPWGNMSYADLIAQAIVSSSEGRATLSQIYDWMVQNIPYFKDKGDSNSSAGWKNSIRHNLSLHNRFMRMQNEGTGKSSWWVLNPDAKPGKSTRRRANTLESSRLEKKRGRVRKKIDGIRASNEPPPSPSLIGESLEYFPNSPSGAPHHHPFQLSPQDYRPRASSNASSCGRLSPIPSMDTDMHDTQVPPISPGVAAWGPDYWSSSRAQPPHMGGPIHEHYADHLVNSIDEGLKLGPRDSWGHHNGGKFQGNRSDCMGLPQPPPHHLHPMNGFLNNHLARNSYCSYEDYNGYIPPSSHCPPFLHHPKDKRRRSHLIHPHMQPLQPLPSNLSSQNISGSGSFVEPQFPTSCEQELRSNPSFPPPSPLPPTTSSSQSSQYSTAPEKKEPPSTESEAAESSTPVPSRSQSTSSQDDHIISESTTMLRVALSHREASSCLMNGNPLYRYNGFGQHSGSLINGLHGSNDLVDLDPSIQEGLDCNVEEVIKHELQYEDHLNFDLEHGQNSSYPYGHGYGHRDASGSQIAGTAGPVPMYPCSSITSGNQWVR